MTNSTDPWPFSTAHAQAFQDYIGIYGEMFKEFGAQASLSSALPSAFLDGWKNLARSMGIPITAPTDLNSVFPAIGLAREHIQMTQTISDLGAQYQRTYAEFLAHLSGIEQEAMRGIQKTNSNPSYDDWIESAEAAYATVAHGATFARLLAQLCNTLSALKVERGKLIEYFCRQLDVPTRAEIDVLHEQVRALREQVRERGSE